MNVQSATPYFDRLYGLTKEKTLAYITAKCSSIADVQDIFQETYAEIYSVILKKGEKYVENETAFVMRVTKRKLAQFYKKAKRQRLIELPICNDEDENIDIPDEIDIEDELIDKDTVKRLFEKLGEKPLDVQKIFHLRFGLDMKLSEIAELMELSQSNVRHKLYRTIKEMRQYLSEEDTLNERK
ncbi:MAG: RNA polymerase sigma factor [Acutalibacteraceae bacterium]